ncbi:MAG: peptidase M50 [Methanoregula sp.]|nr:peptidase M50 [Methanoregula sp.]
MLERITRREESDLFIAWIAISISFAIIKIAPYGITGPVRSIDPVAALIAFGIALLTVGIGFILHEMAHKFTAIKFGYWAEFRKDNIMLLFAVLLAALVGFVFAAPGATVVYSNSATGQGLTKRENGIISASGPVVNLLLCIPFAALVLIGVPLMGASGILLTQIGIFGIQINAMIAAFNMIPISILDGRKVMAWNIPIFALLIIASFGTLVASFYFL